MQLITPAFAAGTNDQIRFTRFDRSHESGNVGGIMRAVRVHKHDDLMRRCCGSDPDRIALPFSVILDNSNSITLCQLRGSISRVSIDDDDFVTVEPRSFDKATDG